MLVEEEKYFVISFFGLFLRFGLIGMVGMAHHANSQTEEGLLFELLFGIVTIDLPIDVPVILMGWHLISTSSLMFVYMVD